MDLETTPRGNIPTDSLEKGPKNELSSSSLSNAFVWIDTVHDTSETKDKRNNSSSSSSPTTTPTPSTVAEHNVSVVEHTKDTHLQPNRTINYTQFKIVFKKLWTTVKSKEDLSKDIITGIIVFIVTYVLICLIGDDFMKMLFSLWTGCVKPNNDKDDLIESQMSCKGTTTNNNKQQKSLSVALVQTCLFSFFSFVFLCLWD